MERVKALSCWAGEDVKIRTAGESKEELQLGEGRTNQNFIVDGKEGRFFVRIGADLPYFGVARLREHAANRAAAEAGLAAIVKHTEMPDAMVCEFVNGRALTEADVKGACDEGRNNKLLQTLTALLRNLHAASVPQELTDFLSEAGGDVGAGGPHLAKWLAYAEECKYTRQPLLDGVRDLVSKLETAAAPLMSSTPKFCHFDLLADNFVILPSGEILLVDFEYTAPGQPLMDLAVLAMGCSLDANQERHLLESYLQADATPTQQYAFKAFKVLAALRETLWGTTAELSKTSALSDEEACSYADMNFNKFKELRVDFEATTPP